ncbi:DUF2314 domain-containing protein [Mesobacterium sp. TK19101]|uniref:DUF2314 domain-containing protein n=1 Tax=Mesobacterium hydrothermale TaxID=3111907 RepID=A0ABU6HF01_9RHOB|nr:DUF2314 domain-containing protein [Mesobacterium sp. TK19101]MEC3860425.1 DUF2314 domain-containing protein [Mesobacterium sp. TK19101]
MSLSLSCAAVALDPLINFDSDDRQMNAAIEEARSFLPTVLDHLIAPDGIAHPALSLKVAVPVDAPGMDNEVIWVDEVRRRGTGLRGELANEPVYFDGAVGDHLDFGLDQIADWGVFGSDGRLYGHYTTRVIVTTLPKKEAKQISDLLSAKPLPDGW